MPELVVHADWSMHPGKRWMATARLMGKNRYYISAPEPVHEISSWLTRLRSMSSSDASILIGMDFPIGLPRAFAKVAGIREFRTTLPQLGTGQWSEFFMVADNPSEISLTRPFYPNRSGSKGEKQQVHLTQALGFSNIRSLMRRCEIQTNAAPMFWTLGSKQVGKAAISGWRDFLQPIVLDGSIDHAIWPFDGPLERLTGQGKVILAETYPGALYAPLGLGTVAKRNQQSRQSCAQILRRWADRAQVELDPSLTQRLASGFGPSEDGEDEFDAFVGLCGMLDVVTGRRSIDAPDDVGVKTVEGWMLGVAY